MTEQKVEAPEGRFGGFGCRRDWCRTNDPYRVKVREGVTARSWRFQVSKIITTGVPERSVPCRPSGEGSGEGDLPSGEGRPSAASAFQKDRIIMSPPRQATNDGRTSKKRSAAKKPAKNNVESHSHALGSAEASHTSASPASRTALPLLTASVGAARTDGHPGVDGEGDLAEVADRLILRPQAARILNVHVSSVRRLEKSGALKPVLTDPSGTHWHSLRAVHEYAAAMKTPPSPTLEENVDGELAAQAFTLLDADATAADLVKTLKIPTAVARKLEQEWAELRGHVIINGPTLMKIRARRSSTDTPLFSGDDILKYMDSIEFENCLGCRRPATFCTLCFHHQPKRAVEAARLELHHAEMRQAAADRAHFERQMMEQARERREYANAAPAPPYEQQPPRRPVPPSHNGPRPDAAQPAPTRPRSGPPNTIAAAARNTDVGSRMPASVAPRVNDGMANIASRAVDATRPARYEKSPAGAPSAGAQRHHGHTRADAPQARPVSDFAGTPSGSWSRAVPPGPSPVSADVRAPRPPDPTAAARAPDHHGTTVLAPQSNGHSRSSGGFNSVAATDEGAMFGTRSIDERSAVTDVDRVTVAKESEQQHDKPKK